jgi:putative aldouronate transport system substrate-binding protein
MKKSKKVCSWLSVLACTTLLMTACSQAENMSSENSSNEKDISKENGPTKITMMTALHTPEVPTDKIINMIEEKTNTDLDIQWIPNSIYNEKVNTAFATDSLPKIVPMGFEMYNQFKEAIHDGQFWEIGPYLKDYENLSKLRTEVIENTKVDGKVYGIYRATPMSRQGYIYRKDWADRLGIEKPTTTEEFYEMLRAFTEDDPDGNGKDDTIGLTDRSDLVYGAFKTIASWFGTPNGWGLKDGELLPEFMFDEYMNTLDYMKEIHSNGYMNQDFPVTSKPDQQAMFKNGTAGVYVGSIGDVAGLYNDGIQLNPDLEYDVHNYVEGPHGEYGIWAIPGFGSVNLFPISSVKTEEELKGILKFYDQLLSPDIANLISYGIEGEHYELVDGLAAPIEENRSTIDRDIRPLSSIHIGDIDTIRYKAYHSYDVKLKAEELILDNNNYLLHNPTVTLESETYTKVSETLNKIILDATYKYILGQIDKEGFNQAIETWQKQGGSDVISEFNADYKK